MISGAIKNANNSQLFLRAVFSFRTFSPLFFKKGALSGKPTCDYKKKNLFNVRKKKYDAEGNFKISMLHFVFNFRHVSLYTSCMAKVFHLSGTFLVCWHLTSIDVCIRGYRVCYFVKTLEARTRVLKWGLNSTTKIIVKKNLDVSTRSLVLAF